ncbi:MAG: F0F1 ATP synthase subunit delta, partial [Gemmataceae bacterium]|nr:F0F1 ATP synthase subunit delta [Gemmataceae bacterium]
MNTTFADQVNTPGALSPDELEHAQHLYEDILLQTDSSRVVGRIARTYAEALLDTAEKRGEADAVGEQFKSLGTDVFAHTPGLEALLATPAVNRHKKDALLVKAFEGRTSPLFLDFLRLLNHKDRLGMLRLIAIAYRSLREARANQVRVLVEAAAPLTDGQKAALT